MKHLEFLARICAVLGGVLLTFITLMTCASLIGRNTVGASLVGDFELTGVACGAAMALFMPWCQLRRANIIVDFFTTSASAAARSTLDRVGAALLGLGMALLCWRSGLGGINAYVNQSGTMMLNFPEWLVYLVLVPALGLTACVALAQALLGFGEEVTA